MSLCRKQASAAAWIFVCDRAWIELSDGGLRDREIFETLQSLLECRAPEPPRHTTVPQDHIVAKPRAWPALTAPTPRRVAGSVPFASMWPPGWDANPGNPERYRGSPQSTVRPWRSRGTGMPVGATSMFRSWRY